MTSDKKPVAHIVYPWNPKLHFSPFSVGNGLKIKCEELGYRVQMYNHLDQLNMALSSPDDVLIGHPNEKPGGCFTDNLHRRWKKKIAIAPWTINPDYAMRMANVSQSVDACVCMSGPRWLDFMPPHYKRCDIYVEDEFYPFLKHKFNPVGERKILYIGCTLKIKNTDLLRSIAEKLKKRIQFGHVGPGIIPGCHEHGFINTDTSLFRRLLEEYDFIISPGNMESDPITLIECMKWGLIPISPNANGFDCVGENILPISLLASQAANEIEKIVELPEEELVILQQKNLDFSKKYTLDNFFKPFAEILNG